jgi:hypothetical protein
MTVYYISEDRVGPFGEQALQNNNNKAQGTRRKENIRSDSPEIGPHTKINRLILFPLITLKILQEL